MSPTVELSKSTMATGIVALRIFGSLARGDADELSDADLLAVHVGRLSVEAKRLLEKNIQSGLGESLSFSWYSERRLRDMYATGDLFAWHIHNESVKLGSNIPDFIDDLTPADYTEAANDITTFLEMLNGVHDSLAASSANATYESGLLFLCARNIAMSASWYVAQGPFFGRRSPFRLEQELEIEFPLSDHEHNENMQARVLGHRGLCLRARSVESVADMSRRLQYWGSRVLAFVQDVREKHHETP